MTAALPQHAPMEGPLPGATGSVEGDADEDEHDDQHDDRSESFHGYSFPIWSMRRSIWRCRTKMPKVSATTPTMASAVLRINVGPEARRSDRRVEKVLQRLGLGLFEAVSQ